LFEQNCRNIDVETIVKQQQNQNQMSATNVNFAPKRKLNKEVKLKINTVHYEKR